MLVSVIVPIYNVEKYLHQCVDSILSQTYKNIEVILVDDGSPDKCPQICDEYAQKDSCVKVIHKKNGGLSDARNVGLENATGKYVIFIDSDDFWIGRKQLQEIVDAVQSGSYDFVGFNCSYYYTTQNKYVQMVAFTNNIINATNKDDIILNFIQSGTFPMSACFKLMNRNFIIKNNLFFKKGLQSEDIPWFINLLDKAKTIKFINIYMYAYRQNVAESITKTFKAKQYDDLFNIVKKELDLLNDRSFRENTKKILFSFFAYEYSILMGLLQNFSKTEKWSRKKELMQYKWLLNYTQNPKVKKINILYHIFGFNLSSKIINKYLKYKFR